MKCLRFRHLLLWSCCMWGLWHPWTTSCTNCLLTVGSITSAFTIQHKAIINRFNFSPLQMCTLFSHLSLPETMYSEQKCRLNVTHKSKSNEMKKRKQTNKKNPTTSFFFLKTQILQETCFLSCYIRSGLFVQQKRNEQINRVYLPIVEVNNGLCMFLSC